MPAEPLTLTARIAAADRGKVLLDYVATRFRYLPREAWQAKIEAGALRVDGAKVSPWLRLERGMQLSYVTEHREPEVDTEVAVLREDHDWLAVNKPAGLPMHADGVFIRNTLVYVLRERFGAQLQPAHRLDRETSGVVMLGKHKAAAQALQMQFQRGEVRKTYLALVRGVVSAAEMAIHGALAKAEDGVDLRRVVVADDVPGAQRAHTHLRVLRRGATATLLELTPHTGRTHQIRAHLASIGHSLLGDVLYGRSDADYLRFVQHVKAGGDARWPEGRDAPRQMLHAASLALQGPRGEPIAITAPMPADMQVLVDALCR